MRELCAARFEMFMIAGKGDPVRWDRSRTFNDADGSTGGVDCTVDASPGRLGCDLSSARDALAGAGAEAGRGRAGSCLRAADEQEAERGGHGLHACR